MTEKTLRIRARERSNRDHISLGKAQQLEKRDDAARAAAAAKVEAHARDTDTFFRTMTGIENGDVAAPPSLREVSHALADKYGYDIGTAQIKGERLLRGDVSAPVPEHQRVYRLARDGGLSQSDALTVAERVRQGNRRRGGDGGSAPATA